MEFSKEVQGDVVILTVNLFRATLKEAENFIINVQIILIDNLPHGEYAFYCLCLLTSIPNNFINSDYSE